MPALPHCLDLICMPTNHHQYISKGLRVIGLTSFLLSSLFKRDNSKGYLGEAIILVRDTPSLPDMHAYQASLKYIIGYKNYCAHTLSHIKCIQGR